MNKLPLFVLTIFLVSSCGFLDRNKSNKRMVARVGSHTLYEEDFNDIFNNLLTPEDSLKLRENYIQKWIRDEILFQNALKNLTDSLTNKQEELDLYYRSLIRYEYEKGLINQKLDTLISEKEIIDYYNQFTESFILKRRVCKATYLVLTNDIPKKEQAISWLEQPTIENIDSLQKYCLRYGVKFNLNRNKWFYTDDLIAETLIPLSFEIVVSENALVHKDSLRTSALMVSSLRNVGDAKPLHMCSQTIRNIIKNKNKVEFIKRMEDDVFLKANQRGEFEIYE